MVLQSSVAALSRSRRMERLMAQYQELSNEEEKWITKPRRTLAGKFEKEVLITNAQVYTRKPNLPLYQDQVQNYGAQRKMKM